VDNVSFQDLDPETSGQFLEMLYLYSKLHKVYLSKARLNLVNNLIIFSKVKL
jgi:hypothetical protein